jgi:uncharacterized membrane protein
MSLTLPVATTGAAFLASLVEVVEAFTIVLAVGITNGWKPAFIGTGLALVALGLLVAVAGPLLALVPLALLQSIIGALLILFGLRWLRKAILRAAGILAQRDEEAAFERESATLKAGSADRRAATIAGIVAFKAVLLEGVEVAFIVLAVGSRPGLLSFAVLGALAAALMVLTIGVLLHRPLSRVPENTLKFVVGCLVSGFGIFWFGEGLGVHWPGGDLALVAVELLVVLVALGLVRLATHTARKPQQEA